MSDEPLSFTRREILDYLPGGWVLGHRDDPGHWNERKRQWEVTVEDIAELRWQLEVPAKAAREHGRIEALRRAIDRLHRAALG